MNALLDGIVPKTFRLVAGFRGLPDSGITHGLLKLASRICQHYKTNVLFYDITGGVIDVRQQLADPQSELSSRLGRLESPVEVDDRSWRRPRLHIIDSAALEGATGHDLAVRLGRGSIQGYSLLILDGWSTYIDRGHPVRHLGKGPVAPGKLIAESTLSAQQLIQITLWADVPLLGGMSTATDGPISSATLAVEAALREYPDRRLFLYYSQLFCATDEWKSRQRPTLFPKLLTLTRDHPGAPNWRPATFQPKPQTAL